MPLFQRDVRSGAGAGERGFILPLTLWVIAAIGIVIVAVNEWVDRAVQNAQALQQRANTELTLSNIQNELVFAMGTLPLSYRGLEVGRLLDKIDRTDPTALMTADFQSDRYIRLDGTPYKLESNEDYTLEIYDGRGLVNLNSISQPYLRRLLGLFGVSEDARNRMIDTLEDYTDRDNLTRIAGAEERDYVRVGRSPPANAWLMTPMEAQYAFGWDEVPGIWERDLTAPLLTTCASTGFNPNTASREALIASFPGMMEEEVKAVMERRIERPFRNIREFAAAANTLVRDDPFFYTFAPGVCIIVEVTHRPTNERTRFSLTIDNFSAKTKPWRIDYAFPIPAKPASVDREPAPEAVFPAPDTVDANQRQQPEDGGQGAPRPLDRQPFNGQAPDL